MTQYERPSFSVAQRGRDPSTCTHGWLSSVRGKLTCRFCGLPWCEIWMREMEDAATARALAAKQDESNLLDEDEFWRRVDDRHNES